MRRIFGVTAASLLVGALAVPTAHAGNIVVGVNIWNESFLSNADQDIPWRR